MVMIINTLLLVVAVTLFNFNGDQMENLSGVEIILLSSDTLDATTNLSVNVELELRNNTDSSIVVPIPKKVDRTEYKDYRPEFFRIEYWDCPNDEFIDLDTYNKPLSMYQEIEPGEKMTFTINPNEYDLWPCTYEKGNFTQIQIIYEPLADFLTIEYLQEIIAENSEDRVEIERKFSKLLRSEVRSKIITLRIQ